MTNPNITRWRRYGHDRLYLDIDGTRIGYWDLNTGTAHPEAPEHEAVIRDAHLIWAHSNPTPTRGLAEPEDDVAALIPNGLCDQPAIAPAPVDLAAVPPTALDPDWDDLTKTKAGAAARAQAQALRNAAPVRTFLARALGAKTDERAWRIGADGEVAVAAQLKKLGERWHVLHAVPIGTRGSDIDHVVIGPPGVFTLNAKNHPDANIWVRGNTFKVNGQNVPYVRNSRYEATRTAKLLGAATGLTVPVTGAIVIYGAQRGLTIKEQPEDVHIVARRQVTHWLRKLPTVLTDEQVAHIYERARRSTTWQPGNR